MHPLRIAACAVLAAAACATAPVAPPPPDDPRAVLDAFSAAVDQGRWDAAYALLSARWRARETPARLKADLAASGSVGPDAVRRVRTLLAAGAPVDARGDVAVLGVGRDKEARLLREAGAWRVDALE